MEQVLLDLFKGRIYPQEQITPGSDHPGYIKASRRLDEIEKPLKDMQTDEGLKLLNEVLRLYGELMLHNSEAVFISGFRLGAQMINAVHADGKPYYEWALSNDEVKE